MRIWNTIGITTAMAVFSLTTVTAQASTYTNSVNFSLSEGSVSVTVTGDIVTDCDNCTPTTLDIVSFSFLVSGSLTDSISGPSSLSGPFVVPNSPLSVSGGQVHYDPSASGFVQFMEYTPAMVVTDQIVFGQDYIDIQVGDRDVTFPTPIPATLPLFAGGLSAMGLLGWRRKRKARVGAHKP
jgi:hypothetical protein